MTEAPARARPFRGTRRSAVCAGVAAVVLAGSGTAYACTTADADVSARGSFHVFTAAEVTALKAEMTSDVASVRAAKLAELAAIRAHDKAAAVAAAKRLAAAKAKLRADLAAAAAKARAEARARVAAAAKARSARADKSDVEGTDVGRHRCDGDHDGWYGDRDGRWDGHHR